MRQRLVHDVLLDEFGNSANLALAADVRALLGVGPALRELLVLLPVVEGGVAAVDDGLEGEDALGLELVVPLGPLGALGWAIGLFHLGGGLGATEDAALGLGTMHLLEQSADRLSGPLIKSRANLEQHCKDCS